ncbi:MULTISPECIES: hypothetical protein [Streptomyces]|uniref:hypothetical protein n=1 Tax=Streptomyces TaxID=1883 RepID=UPI000A4EE0A9|nr:MULTISPECIES: hypothetical protein [Streptomyces]MDI5913159.1 hypothetical protein [Streptomyces sp. 12257]
MDDLNVDHDDNLLALSVPDLVGDIDQAHCEAVQPCGGRSGQDFIQGGLLGKEQVDATVLILQCVGHSHLGQAMSVPSGAPKLVRVVLGDHLEPVGHGVCERPLHRATGAGEFEEHRARRQRDSIPLDWFSIGVHDPLPGALLWGE